PVGAKAISDDQMRRFSQEIKASGSDSGLDMPGVAGADAKASARPLGYLLMGLNADRLGKDVALQSFKTVVATGIALLLVFLFFFTRIARRVQRMVDFAESLAAG